jgi:hypothetical protein
MLALVLFLLADSPVLFTGTKKRLFETFRRVAQKFKKIDSHIPSLPIHAILLEN